MIWRDPVIMNTLVEVTDVGVGCGRLTPETMSRLRAATADAAALPTVVNVPLTDAAILDRARARLHANLSGCQEARAKVCLFWLLSHCLQCQARYLVFMCVTTSMQLMSCLSHKASTDINRHLDAIVRAAALCMRGNDRAYVEGMSMSVCYPLLGMW